MAALALLNPNAGRAQGLAEALRPALGPLALTTTSGSAEACERIRALPPGQRVLVIGGDGTLQPLLGPLSEGDHELALLPRGSGNDLARALGLAGRPWRAVLPHLLQAPATAMDLGELRVEGRAPQCFASSLAVGFDAAVGQRAVHSPLSGLPRYLLATFGELRRLRRYALDVELDGRPMPRGVYLLASCLNTPTYGAGMRAAPGAQLDDGRLQWLGVRGWGRFTAPIALPLMLAGLHRRLPGVDLQAFTQARYRAEAPVPLLLDGEPTASSAEFSVGVRQAALKVVKLGKTA